MSPSPTEMIRSRTGSQPSIPDSVRAEVTPQVPQLPPPPPEKSEEWHRWVTKNMERLWQHMSQLSDSHSDLTKQIGRPPVPATSDPGAGMWMVLAQVREDCVAILAKLAESDAATAKRGSWAARVFWRIIETSIPMLLAFAAAWFALHWR